MEYFYGGEGGNGILLWGGRGEWNTFMGGEGEGDMVFRGTKGESAIANKVGM